MLIELSAAAGGELRDVVARATRAGRPEVAEQVEIQAKYEGYIERQRDEVARRERHGSARSAARPRLSPGARAFDGSAAEAEPAPAGNHWARRRAFPGITPAAISLLLGASEARLPSRRHSRDGMTPQAALERGCERAWARRCPRAHASSCSRTSELLAKWNRTYNLTAMRDPLQMVSHHLLDSLAVLPHLPMRRMRARSRRGLGRRLAGHPARASRGPHGAWRWSTSNRRRPRSCARRRSSSGLRNVEVHDGRVESLAARERLSRSSSRAPSRISRDFVARVPRTCSRRAA